MFQRFLVLPALFLAACSTPPTSTSKAPAAAPAVATTSTVAPAASTAQGDLAGTWEGVFANGGMPTHVKLELAATANKPPAVAGVPAQATPDHPSARHYQGTAYAQGWAQYRAGISFANDPAAERLPVHAVFDPRIGTFRIQPLPQAGGRGARLGLEFHLNNLGGVLNLREPALAGLKHGQLRPNMAPNSGDQYFLFTRAAQFPGVAKSFPPARAMFAGFGGPPSASELRQWAQPFFDQYPSAATERAAYLAQGQIAANLFRDEHFRKFFGSPFDELSANKIEGIRVGLARLAGTSPDINDRRLAALQNLFATSMADNSVMLTLLMVKAQRHLQSWHGDQMATLARLPGAKASLEQTDALEAELAKLTHTVLWPSEFKADLQQLTQARQSIALPALQQMLAELASTPPTFTLMNQLATWQADQARLFSFVSAEQARGLNASAARQLDAVVAVLLPLYRERLAALGSGLPAVTQGNAWHRETTADFAKALRQPQVVALLQAFEQQRGTHLAQAQAAMLAEVEQGHAALPSEMSSAADERRVRYCASLTSLDKAWFNVPGDSTQPTARAVRQHMAKLGGQATRLLPPRLAKDTGFAAIAAQTPDAGTDELYAGFYKSKVDGAIRLYGSLAELDAVAKTVFPKPIREAGFIFKSNVVWALFHGRFDEMDARHYRGQGLGTDVVGGLGLNPRIHFALVSYVGLASGKNGAAQVGPASKLSWNTTNKTTGEVLRSGWGEVTLATVLMPHYEDSYPRAKSISQTDALFGSGGMGILNMFLDFGTGRVLGKLKAGADGELRFGADWEQPILEDLSQLLGTWPAQSYGLWQLQENMVRYMKQRPSLQSLYGFKS